MSEVDGLRKHYYNNPVYTKSVRAFRVLKLDTTRKKKKENELVQFLILKVLFKIFYSVVMRSKDIKDSKKNAYLLRHRQHDANFQGNPLLQATKRHLNNSETVKNNKEMI